MMSSKFERGRKKARFHGEVLSAVVARQRAGGGEAWSLDLSSKAGEREPLRSWPSADAFKSNTGGLAGLDLSGNVLDVKSFEGGAWLWRNSAASLVQLDVSRLGLRSLRGVQTLGCLQSLKASGNQLAQLEHPWPHSLERLDLRGNKLCRLDDVTDSLREAALPRLRELRIGANPCFSAASRETTDWVVLRRARRCREALIYAASSTLFSLEGEAISSAERSGAVAAFRGGTPPAVKKQDSSRQLAESRRLELETSKREKAAVESMLTSVRAEFAQSQADLARVKKQAPPTRRAFLEDAVSEEEDSAHVVVEEDGVAAAYATARADLDAATIRCAAKRDELRRDQARLEAARGALLDLAGALGSLDAGEADDGAPPLLDDTDQDDERLLTIVLPLRMTRETTAQYRHRLRRQFVLGRRLEAREARLVADATESLRLSQGGLAALRECVRRLAQESSHDDAESLGGPTSEDGSLHPPSLFEAEPSRVAPPATAKARTTPRTTPTHNNLSEVEELVRGSLRGSLRGSSPVRGGSPVRASTPVRANSPARRSSPIGLPMPPPPPHVIPPEEEEEQPPMTVIEASPPPPFNKVDYEDDFALLDERFEFLQTVEALECRLAQLAERRAVLAARTAAEVATDQRARLTIIVVEARSLPIMKTMSRSTDAYVVVSCEGHADRWTGEVKNSQFPGWRCQFTFDLNRSDTINFTIYDKKWGHLGGRDDVIGTAILKLGDLKKDGRCSLPVAAPTLKAAALAARRRIEDKCLLCVDAKLQHDRLKIVDTAIKRLKHHPLARTRRRRPEEEQDNAGLTLLPGNVRMHPNRTPRSLSPHNSRAADYFHEREARKKTKPNWNPYI